MEGCERNWIDKIEGFDRINNQSKNSGLRGSLVSSMPFLRKISSLQALRAWPQRGWLTSLQLPRMLVRWTLSLKDWFSMAAHSTGTSSSSLQQHPPSHRKKLIRVKSTTITPRMKATSPSIITSPNTRSMECEKGAIESERGTASAVKMPAVWLQMEKRLCRRIMRGMTLMTVSLRVSSAGILTEYLTTMARLQKQVQIMPRVSSGSMRGTSPLQSTPIASRRMTMAVSQAYQNSRARTFLLASFWMRGSSGSLSVQLASSLHILKQCLRAKTASPARGETKQPTMMKLTQQGAMRAYQSGVKSLKMESWEQSMKSMNLRQTQNSTPKTLALRRRGMTAVLTKLERRTPQKTKEYSRGVELGRRMCLAMTAMRMARTTLEMADTTEAPICRLFVISTLFDISEQQFVISALVYSWARFALQQQNVADELALPWISAICRVTVAPVGATQLWQFEELATYRVQNPIRAEHTRIASTTTTSEQTTLSSRDSPDISMLRQFISSGRLIRVSLTITGNFPRKSCLSGGSAAQHSARAQLCPKVFCSLKVLQWLRKAILAFSVRKWMQAKRGSKACERCKSQSQIYQSSFSSWTRWSVDLEVCLMTWCSFSTSSIFQSQSMNLEKWPWQLKTTSTSKAPLQRESMQALSSISRVLGLVFSSKNSSTATTYLVGLTMEWSFSISWTTEWWKERQWSQKRKRMSMERRSAMVTMRYSFLPPLLMLPMVSLASTPVTESELVQSARAVPSYDTIIGIITTMLMRSRAIDSRFRNQKQRQTPSPNYFNSLFGPHTYRGQQSPSWFFRLQN